MQKSIGISNHTKTHTQKIAKKNHVKKKHLYWNVDLIRLLN